MILLDDKEKKVIKEKRDFADILKVSMEEYNALYNLSKENLIVFNRLLDDFSLKVNGCEMIRNLWSPEVKSMEDKADAAYRWVENSNIEDEDEEIFQKCRLRFFLAARHDILKR